MLSLKSEKKQYESANLVQLLCDPNTYSDGTQRVDLLETHISWLFLTERYVYKLKKPVKYDFLDFSTPQARRQACDEEVRINKRLAYQVYFGVLPITSDETGQLTLNGEGRPIDCVVKMRRLPSDLALDTTIKRDRLDERKTKELANSLASFYCQLPPLILRPEEYYQRTLHHCQSNFRDLTSLAEPLHRPCIAKIHNAQLLFAWLQRDVLFDRTRDGRIVDGHGDLRAEHIFLETPPVVIDGIEFSEELRQIDVLDELSFLAMDCTRLGSSDIGEKLLDTYTKLSGDRPPLRLRDFYKSYRATVRAKVALLRVSQSTGKARKRCLREFHQYLKWADHYASRIGGPYLFIIGGLMGTGKSTLAAGLAEIIAAKVISTDTIRRKLFGGSESPADFGEGNYRPELRETVYREMFIEAGEALDFGQTVILDGTFLTDEQRQRATSLAIKHGANPVHIQCECPIDEARLRIIERSSSSDSEARPELLRQQVAEREELADSHKCIRIDSSQSMLMMIDDIAKAVVQRQAAADRADHSPNTL
ncbi:MAG: AAA family ATPase [Lacipirellulaceae bacterium]